MSGDVLQELKSRVRLPTSRGLADAVTGAIRDEVLSDGDRLPPIRAVAKAMELSPTTVNAAWALLVRGGLLHTDGRRGTVVAIRSAAMRSGGGAGLTRYRRAVDRTYLFELDLATGVPDPVLLPDLGAALRSAGEHRAMNSYLDDTALPELVEVLRADWPYRPGRFTVVDGAMDAQDQVASQLLRFGDRVVVEHPTFPPLLDQLESIGVQLVGVGMDGEGMVVSELEDVLRPGAAGGAVRVVFLQPRAHNPTGVSYSAERIADLAAVIGRSGALVVEDDSAGAISSSPAVSVGKYLPDKTFHIRSFSKSHGPELRLAALSGPSELIDRIIERRRLGQGWTSRLLQSVLLDLLTRPSSVAQVAAARVEYARRRSSLVQALAEHGVQVAARDGLNLWLPVADETAALLHLAGVRIGAAAGRPFASRPESEAFLRVTCGLIPSGHEDVAAELAGASRLSAWRGPR